MPISANKILYDIKRKLNAVNSGKAKDYRIVDLVSFANDAYEIVVENLVSEKDQNETISNHLRPLLVSDVVLKCEQDEVDCGICKAKYPPDFYELIKVRVSVCKDCCPDEKRFSPQKFQGDEIDLARENPYTKADFYFEQLPFYQYKDGLRFYHDEFMDVKSVTIDYYKKLKRIEAPELVECEDHIYRNWDDAVIDENVNFELDSTYVNRKVTDVAVYLASGSSGDFTKSNEKIKEILSLNQIHK